ncbi:hypothetical protein NQ317_002340 [Molorchus minor]|uniref:Uncharacterized protein n=1 Tax=Molorchus minor TaxID=1323400 RepID=A0ABQ9IRU0_9CUCU|nr:hypothetical protein NQ317_002340 [Molorchus minor]
MDILTGCSAPSQISGRGSSPRAPEKLGPHTDIPFCWHWARQNNGFLGLKHYIPMGQLGCSKGQSVNTKLLQILGERMANGKCLLPQKYMMPRNA